MLLMVFDNSANTCNNEKNYVHSFLCNWVSVRKSRRECIRACVCACACVCVSTVSRNANTICLADKDKGDWE